MTESMLIGGSPSRDLEEQDKKLAELAFDSNGDRDWWVRVLALALSCSSVTLYRAHGRRGGEAG